MGWIDRLRSDEISAITLKVHDKVYIDAKDRDKYAQELLEPFHNQIEELLCCKSMTYRQLHRLLKEQGLEKCSEKTLVRYIAKLFPKPKEYTIHIDDKPGMEAQVDYADVGVMFGNVPALFLGLPSLRSAAHRLLAEPWLEYIPRLLIGDLIGDLIGN